MLTKTKDTLEEFLPISIIRDHIKANDIPLVTDDQLVLYRQAAFEAAEQYTGMVWHGVQRWQQDASLPEGKNPFRQKSILRLDRPVMDGVVTVVGHSGSRTYSVAPGARKVAIDVFSIGMDINTCCSPCQQNSINYGCIAYYNTGITCADQLPGGIRLGMLKFIAWNVENPGDVLMTVKGAESNATTGIIGTNNAAWASGAIEMWRPYARGFNT